MNYKWMIGYILGRKHYIKKKKEEIYTYLENFYYIYMRSKCKHILLSDIQWIVEILHRVMET
jgi:hypothetical protein